MSQAQLCPTASPSVSIHKGRPSTTSLEVAKFFGKQHAHVLRSVKELTDNTPKEFTASNFGASEYTDETGRTLPMFILHRDGFMLLVMGYTGKKAMQIKIAYIQAFNAMEAQISGNAQPQLPLDISTTQDRKPLENLVKVWASQAGMPHAQAWTQVNGHFNLESITELPTAWIPDAIAFVEGKIDGVQKALPAVPTPRAVNFEHIMAALASAEKINNEKLDDLQQAIRMTKSGMRGAFSVLQWVIEIQYNPNATLREYVAN